MAAYEQLEILKEFLIQIRDRKLSLDDAIINLDKAIAIIKQSEEELAKKELEKRNLPYENKTKPLH